MMTPLQISIGSAIIASAAFLVSLLALWKTHFARFSVLSVAGCLRQRLYPIRGDSQRWYLASFDIPISFTNKGARPGIVRELRLSLHFPKLPIPNNRELIYAKWEINPQEARRIDKDRFRWLDELTITDWMSFPVLPGQTVTKHIIFETRWEEPIIQPMVEFKLELLSGATSQWRQVAMWELPFDAGTWTDLTEHGTSISTSPHGHEEKWPSCYPQDLHKYTGSKESVLEEHTRPGPSYLDYPKNNSS